jgi:nitroreductase
LLHAAITERRSVRAFLPDPVQPELLRAVFETAQRAPSNCNVQPWVVHVVSGEALAGLARALRERAASGCAIEPDFPLTGAYPGVYRERQIASAKAYFSAAGVERHAIEARQALALRNFTFFGAPHAAFMFMPDWAGWREAADVGMYAQSLMLALHGHGLGSCAQGALGHYANVVHEMLAVPTSLRLLFGLSFGYPHAESAVARVHTDRAPVEVNHIFHE